MAAVTTSAAAIRPATIADAAACAAIKNAWIDATPWMPRVHSHEDVERHYRDFVLVERTVRIAEAEGPVGYMALDEHEGYVTSLFVARQARSGGAGKQLIDHAKSMRDDLRLWTFEANDGARRFYAREGFVEVERSDGDNEEGLPDILLRWTA